MIAYGGQADRALDVLEDQIGNHQSLAVNPDPSDPQTPFPTALVLTYDQEDAMVAFAMEWLERLEADLGRIVYTGTTVPIPNERTWMGRRELFTLRYYNHVEDRPLRTREDNIWRHSNIVASIAQRITMQMTARANNFFFGTDPWYSVHFVGTADKPLSERIDRHSKWKFDITGLNDVLMAATEFAFVRGESVLKTISSKKERFYKKQGKALFDGKTTEPVLDSTGNFIFPSDAWIPEMGIPSPDPSNLAAAQQQGLPPPPPTPTGRQVLRRDPLTVMPALPIWRDGIYPMRRLIFQGPDCSQVYFKDFLCPLDAPSIHDAPINIHLYDMPIMDLIETFRRSDLAQMGAAESLQKMAQAIQVIRSLTGQGMDPKAAAGQPRGDFGEGMNTASPENQLSEVAECYLKYDADGDGIAEEIMLVLDRRNRFPLFYDYLDNVCEKGRRPFEVIRGKPVDGRWYGMGSMEYFEPEQATIDLMVNRRNMRMSDAGRVTFWNPNATMEGSANPHLKLNHGRAYRLKEGFKAEDALSYVELPDTGEDLMELLQFFMQMAQLKSGIINGADQQASDMKGKDTATGVINVEKSGQEMFAQWLNALEPGHKAVLLSNIRVLYANLSQPEMYRFFDADANTHSTDILSPEEVAGIEFEVQILLTRIRQEQVLQMSAEARALVLEYYTQYPPQIQPIVAPMFQDSLKALGYQNAEYLIIPQQGQIIPGQNGMPPTFGAPVAPTGAPMNAPKPPAAGQLSTPLAPLSLPGGNSPGQGAPMAQPKQPAQPAPAAKGAAQMAQEAAGQADSPRPATSSALL